ncbi:hypothetical protein ATL39_3121 [Sinobaca qinghaiensis]|uniref:Tubby C-terminal domain-containing protein n=1 Tax=Sinobaca qinghaiensis TaxID=342944 RepID=A0A419UX49_9BACL|nr:hypothetical protein [Sinobaca qinghaiensis]RKD69694.1 hypothetical protein ATL39_3121 [Sinobaca qinghaiensis]
MGDLTFSKPFFIFSARKISVEDKQGSVRYYCRKWYRSKKEVLTLSHLEHIYVYDENGDIIVKAEQTSGARATWDIKYGEDLIHSVTMINHSRVNTSPYWTIRFQKDEYTLQRKAFSNTTEIRNGHGHVGTMKQYGAGMTKHEISWYSSLQDRLEPILLGALYLFTLKDARPS